MALNILSIKEIGEFLKGKQLYVIARETGISYPTLAKFANKKPHNFTLTTMVTLTNYIKKANKATFSVIDEL